jgi:hypothetical protein
MSVRKTKLSSSIAPKVETVTAPVAPSPSRPPLPTLQGASDASRVVGILTACGIGNWKNPGGTDKEQLASGEQGPGHHSYGAVYEAIVNHLTNNGGVESVLEIGVQRGGSLLLWQELCPGAKVVGVDIENQIHETVLSRLDQDGVITFWGDAYSPEMVTKTKACGPFSLIIDDGPHTFKSQKKFIEQYLPLLAKGGVAVIEDIQSEEAMLELAKAVPSGYCYQTIDRREVNGRWDDLMLVIEEA